MLNVVVGKAIRERCVVVDGDVGYVVGSVKNRMNVFLAVVQLVTP